MAASIPLHMERWEEHIRAEEFSTGTYSSILYLGKDLGKKQIYLAFKTQVIPRDEPISSLWVYRKAGPCMENLLMALEGIEEINKFYQLVQESLEQ